MSNPRLFSFSLVDFISGFISAGELPSGELPKFFPPRQKDSQLVVSRLQAGRRCRLHDMGYFAP
ncbi:hypothetical protein, partial [Klebsiella pneumoniae]|uniref:hypothetical protein n=1 Tax=Klebsiella pneumoniae TaxID=573 RepID=UPI003968AC3F